MTTREDQSLELIDNDPVESVKQAGRNLLVYAGGTFALFFVGMLIYVLSLVHAYLVYLGYLALAAAGVGIVCLIAFPVVLLLRLVFQAKDYEIPQHGLAFRSPFGKVETFAPLAAANVKYASSGQSKNKKGKQLPPMLSLFDMIEQGIIQPGSTKVVIGYETDGLTLVIGDRPPTQAIAGKGRSGKTRRAIFAMAQDLIGGAKITVCDPHGLGKRDALAKIIAPLKPWVRIVCTEEEIVQATRDHIAEMRKRTSGQSDEMIADGFYLPRVIYYDEWSSLMTRYSEETTTLLKECLEDCSREYGGVQGYATIIGQSWVDKECGGTGIRRALHDVFVHNISPEYAKFLISDRRFYSKTEELPVKNCYYKPFVGKVKEVITPFVSDDAPAKLAEILQELYPVQQQQQAPERAKEIPETLARPRVPGDQPAYTSWNRNTTGSLYEQVAYHQPMASYPQLPAAADTQTLESEVSALSASASLSNPQAQNTIIAPEAKREAEAEAGTGSNQPAMNTAIYKAALRDIARRLERGEDPIAIRKSLEINGGRALQEVNAALKFIDQARQEDTAAQE